MDLAAVKDILFIFVISMVYVFSPNNYTSYCMFYYRLYHHLQIIYSEGFVPHYEDNLQKQRILIMPFKTIFC